jgi:hypothetical protein
LWSGGYDRRILRSDYNTSLACILIERRHSLAAETGYWEFDARRGDGTTLPIEFAAGHVDLPDAERYTLVVREITFPKLATGSARRSWFTFLGFRWRAKLPLDWRAS